MRVFRRICVYCGSSDDVEEVYRRAATHVGTFLAQQAIGVVYGGGSVGLMGLVAEGALAAGGEVIGVIPEKLMDLELGHANLTQLHVVPSMHDRKLKMAELADAFIALPGGFGTLEELFEVTTWTQLNYHVKPVGILNVAGYYDGLLAFLDQACDAGFIRPLHRPLIQSARDPAALLDALATVDIPRLKQWLTAP